MVAPETTAVSRAIYMAIRRGEVFFITVEFLFKIRAKLQPVPANQTENSQSGVFATGSNKVRLNNN